LRLSKIFLPTTKEAPKDAVLPSHIYLIRGGFISQIGSGIYNFLPLGKIVLDKIRAIVKEELDKAGCQEVQLGFVTPLSLWDESGRSAKFGNGTKSNSIVVFIRIHECCTYCKAWQ